MQAALRSLERPDVLSAFDALLARVGASLALTRPRRHTSGAAAAATATEAVAATSTAQQQPPHPARRADDGDGDDDGDDDEEEDDAAAAGGVGGAAAAEIEAAAAAEIAAMGPSIIRPKSGFDRYRDAITPQLKVACTVLDMSAQWVMPCVTRGSR